MAKKSKVAERELILSVLDVAGWVLICKDDDKWHIAWDVTFGTKKRALHFAASNNWPKPYRAVRGRLTVCG